MATRWCLLLGLALFQGILSFSPISEMDNMDEEWAQFNQSQRLDNPNYRLPTTTRPRHYEVHLTPYLDVTPGPNIQPFTFDGEVSIFTSATQADVRQIVIHCNDLIINTLTVTYNNTAGVIANVTITNEQFVCDPITSFLTINTTEALAVGQEYIIRSTFRGNLQTNMRGFYRSWYRDSTGIRWMATTQFQPGHARQAFPCYDEPSFKATFDISISRDENFSQTLSNMRIRNTSEPVNQRVTDHFETTPVTSTYLLAIIVSHYAVVSTNNNPTRPFTIHARNNSGTNGDWSLEVGEQLLARMENYTGIPYYNGPLPSGMIMQQAAIPDFSAGAMENWGLLTYREALILYDPLNSNHFYMNRVANIVAHEIAHMWFGNLVTCAWWDNLWLNEGFARFYQYYLTDLVRPDMGYDTRFIVEQVHSAMVSDSTDQAHALTNPAVGSPTTVTNHFSVITYARGAAVLRMTQYLLGRETFERALRNYLDERKFDVAEPHHLFNAFDAAAVADRALTAYGGITIEEYFKTWSEKPGHPVVTVRINQNTGEMIVTQERFERTNGYSANSSLYHVPITWTREGAIDFTDLKPSRIMTAQIEVIDRGTTGLEWVVFNKQQSGFYRVNYDNTNWILLTRALRTNYTVIHEHNRAQIVDDLFAFARATTLTYEQVLNVLSYLEFEDGYAPWIAAISGFNFAIRRLAHDNAQREELNRIILALSDAVVRRLGYSEPAGEGFMPSLQRMYVMTFLCDVGHEGCINAARTNFANWRTGTHIAPNLRPWVYCAGLRNGNASDFDFLWNRYLAEDLASEQLVLIGAAGCTTDTASLNRFWEAITSAPANDGSVIIRGQDLSTALSSAITSNEENTMKSFEWIRANIQRTNNTIGLSSPLNSIFSRLLNEEQITQATTWLDENRLTLGESIYVSSMSAIGTSRSNIAWYERRASEFASYFETGYVEQEIETGGEDGSGGGEDGSGGGEDGSGEGGTGEGGDGGNSASTAILSVATLFATLSINFLS